MFYKIQVLRTRPNECTQRPLVCTTGAWATRMPRERELYDRLKPKNILGVQSNAPENCRGVKLEPIHVSSDSPCSLAWGLPQLYIFDALQRKRRLFLGTTD